MPPVRPWAVLATCCLSLFLVTMDVTVVNVALRDIGRDLHTSVAGLQWSIDAYTIVIASFLVLAGSTADRLGRRRVFQIGLTIFTIGSVLCSTAWSIETLVAFRVVQAIGGAMMNPVAMSIIVNTFVDPVQRARAIGLWGAVFGLSMAIGPLLGGILVQTIGWPAIFWVNAPIGVAAILLTRRFVPESRAERARRIDPIGQILIVALLAALTTSLIQGWPWMGAVAGAAFVALVAYESRRHEPLIDLRFFKSIPFAMATVIAVVTFTTFNGALFLSSLYLQVTRGLAPARAGMCLMPIAGALFICSPLSGRLVGANRARWAMVAAGFAMIGAAITLLPLEVDTPIVQVIGAFVLFGIAMGMVNAPITNAAVSGMPRAQAGVASALASTSRQVGATLGIALSGALVEDDAARPSFATSTHVYWWIIVFGGAAIVVLGLVATSARARRTADAVAASTS